METIDRDRADVLIQEALELYNQASDEQKQRLKNQVEINLQVNAHGLKHIGMGLDPTAVFASEEFLKLITA
jgi:hypothetical protein